MLDENLHYFPDGWKSSTLIPHLRKNFLDGRIQLESISLDSSRSQQFNPFPKRQFHESDFYAIDANTISDITSILEFRYLILDLNHPALLVRKDLAPILNTLEKRKTVVWRGLGGSGKTVAMLTIAHELRRIVATDKTIRRKRDFRGDYDVEENHDYP